MIESFSKNLFVVKIKYLKEKKRITDSLMVDVKGSTLEQVKKYAVRFESGRTDATQRRIVRFVISAPIAATSVHLITLFIFPRDSYFSPCSRNLRIVERERSAGIP